MKTCTKCKIEQNINQFGIKNNYHDGLNPWCKTCKKGHAKLNYLKNKDKIKQKAKEYYSLNKEQILNFSEEKRQKRNEYKRNWNKENNDLVKKYISNYRKQKSDRISKRKKEYRENNKELTNKTRKNWIKKNPIAKLGVSVRKRLGEYLRLKGYKKSYKFEQYIGCDKNTLIAHIESKFTDGMTWDNHGDWHLDHIIPLASATTEQELYSLCHYTNLQPLWGIDNIKKGCRI